MSEIYVSTDIETDGPIPGPNSMLSFGSAAFSRRKEHPISTFSANLECLEGASADPVTMSEFWDKNPEAWTAARKDPRDVATVMREYVAWLDQLPGRPVFVGYPVTFDFMFIYHYLIKFVGRSPFSFSGIDIKSYAMAVLGSDFRETTKRNMPKSWFSRDAKHTHVALDDAIEQGYLWMAMLRGRTESP